MRVAFDANVIMGALRAIIATKQGKSPAEVDAACLSEIKFQKEACVPSVALFEVTRRMTDVERAEMPRLIRGMRVLPFDDGAAEAAAINHDTLVEKRTSCPTCLEIEGEHSCAKCGRTHSPNARRNDWMMVCACIHHEVGVFFTLDGNMQKRSGNLMLTGTKTSPLRIEGPTLRPEQLNLLEQD